MPRPYSRPLDVPFMTRRRDRIDRPIASTRRTIADGRADEGVADGGVDLCTEAAALAWVFEEPQDVVQGHLQQGAEFARWAVSSLPPPYRWRTVFGWLHVGLLAGDEQVVRSAAVTALDPARLEPLEATWVAVPLLWTAASLVLADEPAAAAHVADLRGRAGLPGASAEELRRAHGLPEMAEAVLARDQAALEAACLERSARNARHWGRSVENRRHPHGFLDPEASLVVATAPRYGLTPPDVPDLPRGLMPGPHRS